jgi:hypothetical protein
MNGLRRKVKARGLDKIWLAKPFLAFYEGFVKVPRASILGAAWIRPGAPGLALFETWDLANSASTRRAKPILRACITVEAVAICGSLINK